MATPLSDERVPLTLVKDTPETARVFEFEKRPRPAWMMSGEQLRQWAVYAKDNTVDAVRFTPRTRPTTWVGRCAATGACASGGGRRGTMTTGSRSPRRS
jgi:hypothetical protein